MRNWVTEAIVFACPITSCFRIFFCILYSESVFHEQQMVSSLADHMREWRILNPENVGQLGAAWEKTGLKDCSFTCSYNHIFQICYGWCRGFTMQCLSLCSHKRTFLLLIKLSCRISFHTDPSVTFSAPHQPSIYSVSLLPSGPIGPSVCPFCFSLTSTLTQPPIRMSVIEDTQEASLHE